MPRSYQLTWQSGTAGRSGRWRKKYRGKVYHFSGGRGKSDREAYEAALAAWEKLKLRIDASAPKPHEAAYTKAIHEWELALAWSRQHGEEDMSETAIAKLGRLRQQFEARKPVPVEKADTFEAQFDRNVRHPELSQLIANTANIISEYLESQIASATSSGELCDQSATETIQDQTLGSSPNSNPPQIIDPSGLDVDVSDPLQTERAIWQDRLEVMQRQGPEDETLRSFIDRFHDSKMVSVSAGEVSLGRAMNLKSHLDQFAVWVGENSPVVELTSLILSNYRLALLRKVEKQECTRTTANDRLADVKSFVRWLWQIEAIPSLPRNMDGRTKALTIGTSSSEIKVFTKKEISKLLDEASDRTKLFLLLMLNCGMTQKDIADLQHSEVDWDAGRIIRKRSKTRKHGKVPEVNYKLWPETIRLLKQERNRKRTGTVLLNANGQPLLAEEVTADGKYKKNDNIKSAFQRLQIKTKIKKPLKSLKKTSATLIRGSEKYASLESLFLGHAGGTIAHRHYAKAPQNLLDQAIGWLATEYGLE